MCKPLCKICGKRLSSEKAITRELQRLDDTIAARLAK